MLTLNCTRYLPFKLAGLLLPGLISLILLSCNQPPDIKPNIIFILTDDQGWGDITANGNDLIETPNMDRLSREGASFTRFYVSPLCAASRASFLTGKYHLRTGTVSVSRGMERMRAEETTIAEILKDHGYTTGCFGKWHNGENYPENPQGQGFDEFLGFAAGHWNNYFDTQLEHNGEMIKTSGYISDVITDASLDFIESNKEKPFFCYIPYNAPHGPFQVPDSYFNKYQEKGLDDRLAAIYAMCENLDDNLGRIIDKVQELGLSENTILIFATDNGPNGQRYNGNMKGVKGHVDEGGVRVPFFVNWKGKIKPGKQIDLMGGHIDLLPTLLELSGIPLPDSLEIDGISLAPALLKPQYKTPPRNIYTHVNFMTSLTPYPGAVRDGRYVLTVKEGGKELYDLQNDPRQEQDLSNSQRDIFQKLQAQYLEWYQKSIAGIEMERAIPVGYPETKQVELAVQEAEFRGGLQFKEGHGWANDWLINWNSPEDSIIWKLKVHQPSIYRISIKYTLPASDTGAMIEIDCNGQLTQATLSEAFDPEYLPSQDRVPRMEVYEKEWATLEMGEIFLDPGEQQLILRALQIPGKQVCELKSVILSNL